MRWAGICPTSSARTWPRRPSTTPTKSTWTSARTPTSRAWNTRRTARRSASGPSRRASSWWTAPSATWARRRPTTFISASSAISRRTAWRSSLAMSAKTSFWRTTSARASQSLTTARILRFTLNTPWWPRAAGGRTGWRSSARSTTSPTPRAPWTSASGWRSATRSWRW